MLYELFVEIVRGNHTKNFGHELVWNSKENTRWRIPKASFLGHGLYARLREVTCIHAMIEALLSIIIVIVDVPMATSENQITCKLHVVMGNTHCYA